MKAKSLLSLVCYSNRSINPSIYDVSVKVYHLLSELSHLDLIFSETVHFNGSKESVLKIGGKESIDDIAKLILNSEWNEITQHEGMTKPTTNYKREGEGFSFNSKFLSDGEKRFSFNYGCGYSVDGVSFYNFNRDYQYNFEWYERLIKCLVSYLKPFYASIYINNEGWNKFYRAMNIKYPIGWITYFSDSYEICIPDNLTEVRYEFVEGGKYLYTSDNDFMKDQDIYFEYKEKLEKIITDIKNRVPEFIKE